MFCFFYQSGIEYFFEMQSFSIMYLFAFLWDHKLGFIWILFEDIDLYKQKCARLNSELRESVLLGGKPLFASSAFIESLIIVYLGANFLLYFLSNLDERKLQ